MVNQTHNVLNIKYRTNLFNYKNEIFLENERIFQAISLGNESKEFSKEIDKKDFTLTLKVSHYEVKPKINLVQKIIAKCISFLFAFLINDFYELDPWNYVIHYKMNINQQNPAIKIFSSDDNREKFNDKSKFVMKTYNCEIAEKEEEYILDREFIAKSFKKFEQESKEYLLTWIILLALLCAVFLFLQSFTACFFVIVIAAVFTLLFFVGRRNRKKAKTKYLNLL